MSGSPDHRAVVCFICNGKYFPKSFPFHLKGCAQKNSVFWLTCHVCEQRIRAESVLTHLKTCVRPSAHATTARSSGNVMTLDDRRLPRTPDWRRELGGMAVGESLLLERCSFCSRSFSADRRMRHEAACLSSPDRQLRTSQARSSARRKLASTWPGAAFETGFSATAPLTRPYHTATSRAQQRGVTSRAQQRGAVTSRFSVSPTRATMTCADQRAHSQGDVAERRLSPRNSSATATNPQRGIGGWAMTALSRESFPGYLRHSIPAATSHYKS